MKKILIPIDGSPRSLIAVEEVKRSFSPKAFEIILLMVQESQLYTGDPNDEDEILAELEEKLKIIESDLDDYTVTRRAAIGKPGNKIVDIARETGVNMIVMTRSTKTNLSNSIGMSASYVIRHAPCNVMIVQERKQGAGETYRGMVYRKAESVVNLRGQLSLKQSECLLPTVKGDTVYHIQVTRGRVRFTHRSFNKETAEWDIPPLNGQQEAYDIMEGESIDIPINSENDEGRPDRIRVINRSMKTEAVFSYKITRA